jgi:membrane-associated phospholipid phosphatase
VRTSEALAIAYFGYLSISAAVVRLSGARRAAVWLASLVVISIELAVAGLAVGPRLDQLRDWLPMFVILTAYFATGLFYTTPSPGLEAWLQRWDERLLRGWCGARLPPAARTYLEVVYDACFLLIPAGFAVLVWVGRSAAADRYWTLVSAAEFGAFATLPWMQARPPWAIDEADGRTTELSSVRKLSLVWVKHTTIRANTFPSGHASASLAVALALVPELPLAAVVFAVLAISVSAGSVAGRFHYAIDALAGILLALLLAAIL